MSTKKKAKNAQVSQADDRTTRAATTIQTTRHRLYDLENLLNTVAKATRDEDNDTEGSMQIACRELVSMQADLEEVANDLEGIRS